MTPSEHHEGSPRIRVTRASDIPPASPERIGVSEAIRRAALDVLPERWRVLPDGRATHSVIALHASSHLRKDDTQP